MMQNTSETQEDVLSSKAIEYLGKQRPKLISSERHGVRKIAASLFIPTGRYSTDMDAMKVFIPARFNTLEATMFLGLNKETASIIHAHVMRYPEALHILSSAVE
jgi:hypothetical protein